MDQVRIHLMISHLPIFGSILGGLVLLHGIGVKSDQTIIAAYYVLILSSLGAVIAYSTGEGAEEAVESIQGVTKNSIHLHEDFALAALMVFIAAGIVSILGLYLTIKESWLAHPMAILALIVAIIGFALVARAGYLGGKIRHTEIVADTIAHRSKGASPLSL